MDDIKPGNLISTLDYRGKKVYSIVLVCYNRYSFKEVMLLSEGKIKSIIIDGSKSPITLEQEAENESRTPTKTL